MKYIGKKYDHWNFNDGGRAKAGYKGFTGDCGVRALAICLNKPYKEVYEKANEFCKAERPSKRRRGKSNARTGIHGHTFKKIAESFGLKWTPTMFIGSGTTVHLKADELPKGRIICNVSKHYTAVVDGVIQDTYDPSRRGTRAVYGYYTLPSKEDIKNELWSKQSKLANKISDYEKTISDIHKKIKDLKAEKNNIIKDYYNVD